MACIVCDQAGAVLWIKSYLKAHHGKAHLQDLTGFPRCLRHATAGYNNIINDLMQIPDIQKHFIIRQKSLCLPVCYASGLKKLIKILTETGPQTTESLDEMFKKVSSKVERFAVGYNHKEIHATCLKEPDTFNVIVPPGLVMLKHKHHESDNPLVHLMERLEDYLLKHGPCSPTQLMTCVVQQSAPQFRCVVKNEKSLKQILNSQSNRFHIGPGGVISLTRNRKHNLEKTSRMKHGQHAPNLHGVKYNGRSDACESASHCSSSEDVNSVLTYKSKETHPSCPSSQQNTDFVSSSNPTQLTNCMDKSHRKEDIRMATQPNSANVKGNNSSSNSYCGEIPRVHISKNVSSGVRIIIELLQMKGPMVLSQLHNWFLGSAGVTEADLMVIGNTEGKFLSTLQQNGRYFHIIEPHHLVLLRSTCQMRKNPWVTGLQKIKAFISDKCEISALFAFTEKKLTPDERLVFGTSLKALKQTLSCRTDIFRNTSKIVFLKEPMHSEAETRQHKKERRKEIRNRKRARAQERRQRKKQKTSDIVSDNLGPCQLPEIECDTSNVQILQKNEYQTNLFQSQENDNQNYVGEYPESSSQKNVGQYPESSSQVYVGQVAESSNTVCQPEKLTVTVLQSATNFVSVCLPYCSPDTKSVVGIAFQDGWLLFQVWSGEVFAVKLAEDSSPHSEDVDRATTGVQGFLQDLLGIISFPLHNPSVMKVVYNAERVCKNLSLWPQLHVENMFDVMIADQLLRRSHTGEHLPQPMALHQLYDAYGIVPPAEVEVIICSTTPPSGDQADDGLPTGMTEQDVLQLKTFAQRYSMVVPHLFQRLFEQLDYESLIEHNQLMEESISANWSADVDIFVYNSQT